MTFFVLAPEHALVDELTSSQQRVAVQAYREQAARQSEIERMQENRPKSGVFTGGYVIHPLTGERIPVWIADYVLAGYGSGAVMGVPAHDERDFAFARQEGLPVRVVVAPPQAELLDGAEWSAAYPGEGLLVNSGSYDGLPSRQAGERIAAGLAARGMGGPKVNYRMRDWLISRQRYWGAPIPIIHCPDCGEVAVPEEQLPVLLPEMQDFEPDGSGRSPLGRVPGIREHNLPAVRGSGAA